MPQLPIIYCEEIEMTDLNGEASKRWRFFCGHCLRYHHHSPEQGHRVAHCDSDSPFKEEGYFLKLKPEPKTMFDTFEASAYLSDTHNVQRARATLAKLRVYGTGPKYCKFGKSVRYRKEDLDAWVKEITSAPMTKTTGERAHAHADQG